MSSPDNQAPESAQKQNDKEHNFRALEARYERKLAEERQARLELENRIKSASQEDDDTSDEPYVDHKKLDKKLARFGRKLNMKLKTKLNMLSMLLSMRKKEILVR